MSSKILLVTIGCCGIGGFAELEYASSTVLERCTFATPAILIGTGFWSLMHGFKVGRARSKYAELAKKDGEENVDERFNLPNLYAQGVSKHVTAFNCIQRSHQQIFETYTACCVSALAGAVSFPACTSLSTLLYAVGRYYLSKGYAECEGDASKRYKYKLARYMWYGFLGNMILGATSCVMIISGMKIIH